ncbi:MAG: PqqD family peptide modification chaperone [Caldisericia bacterium]
MDGTNTPLMRRPNTTTRKIGSQVVVLDYDNSTVTRFNEVGSLIWAFLEKPIAMQTVANLICKEYDIDMQTVIEDVREFIAEYRDDNLFIDPKEAHIYERKKKRLNDIVHGQLEEIGFENTLPVMVEIQLTDKCNLSCIHCSVVGTKRPILKTDEFSRIIDQLESAGCFEVTFTGGEIFTRKDALDIIGYADRKDFAINLLTSASLLTVDQIETLAKLRLNNVQVSIYSSIPNIHDSITRVRGSFHESIRNIELMVSHDIHVTLACVVMNINYPTYKSVQELAKGIGADCTIAYPVRARDDGSKDTFTLRIDDKEVFQLFKENQLRFCKKHERDLESPICHAGRAICSISSRGDVYPCILFPMKVGNLREKTFEEIWNNSTELSYFRNLKLKDTYQCKDCKLMEYCPICPGLSLLEEGDMLAPAKINCVMASAMYKTLNDGKEVMNL